MAAFAVEGVVNELAQRLNMDPLELRLKNAAKEGTRSAFGPTFGPIGLTETLKAAKAHPHYSAPLGPNQGRGVACGFWFNFGGQTCVSLNVNIDGTVALAVGTPHELKQMPGVTPAGTHWLEIVGPDAAGLLERLRGRRDVLQATIFGQSVHALTESSLSPEDLGLRDAHVLVTEPSLEDVFVALSRAQSNGS